MRVSFDSKSFVMCFKYFRVNAHRDSIDAYDGV